MGYCEVHTNVSIRPCPWCRIAKLETALKSALRWAADDDGSIHTRCIACQGVWPRDAPERHEQVFGEPCWVPAARAALKFHIDWRGVEHGREGNSAEGCQVPPKYVPDPRDAHITAIEEKQDRDEVCNCGEEHPPADACWPSKNPS